MQFVVSPPPDDTEVLVMDVRTAARNLALVLSPRPELGGNLDIPAPSFIKIRPAICIENERTGTYFNIYGDADNNRTAEIAANAPRYRRKSSTFIDGIHDVTENQGDMAPAQLYSTMSGRLFHSGRIAIVLVGLPARGKT